MSLRNIIVIGASSGGFEALKVLVSNLPPDLPASIFIVWHMAPDLRGILPDVLNRSKTIYAANAIDEEPILSNRIYVAPPDHHLLVERGRVRVTRGPKENRFRPAVDPLFRSAAYTYGTRVIGIVLSGALDDGASGLWTVKDHGGLAIVQDPRDAEVPSMPENAMRAVQVDYSVPIADMANLLVELVQQPVVEAPTMEKDEKTAIEIRIAAEENSFEIGSTKLGELTPYTCPDCHGVLFQLKDGDRIRFRCHTGHAFSADVLLAAVTQQIEDSLWTAIRGVQESVMLLNHLGSHLTEVNQTTLAELYFTKAQKAEKQAELMRQAVMQHEQFSEDSLQEQAEQRNGLPM